MYYLHRKWQRDTLGITSTTETWDVLRAAIVKAKEDGVDSTLWTKGAHYRLTVCTPLMKRAHTLEGAGGMIFVDGCTDFIQATKDTFVVVLAATPAGALPLGMFITDKGTKANMTACFRQLQRDMPKEAYFGMGDCGPTAIMADAGVESKSLAEIWPDTPVYLCLFHFLQAGKSLAVANNKNSGFFSDSFPMSLAAWTWLQKHMEKDHRKSAYGLIAALAKAADKSTFDRCLQKLRETFPDHSVRSYINKKLKSKDSWSLAFRPKSRTAGHNTNNYAEAVFR